MKRGWVVLRWLAALSSVPLVFSLVGASADEGRFVRVTAEDVNIRAGGSTETAVIGQAEYGESFHVLGTADGWYHVRIDATQTGWISAALVSETKRFGALQDEMETVEATASVVNVRGGASLLYEVVGQIQPGTSYPLLQRSGDWAQVRLPSERTGWVHTDYVRVAAAPTRDVAAAERARTGGEPPLASPASNSQNAPTATLRERTNLRSGPGLNHAVIRVGAAGHVYPILAQAGNWLQVALADGQRAWVANWLPTLSGSLATVPVQQTVLDSSLRGRTIVLDPGHGGVDVGAVGRRSGVFEKDLALSVSRQLYNKLQATGAHVVLTRPDDRFVSLADRVFLAESQRADVFLSLHFNTHHDPGLTGSMTFYYSPNGADRQLATMIQQELTATLGLPDLGARYGDYYVLRENSQTAVLVELGFLTNAGDEGVAQDLGRQERAAEGLFRALVRHLTP